MCISGHRKPEFVDYEIVLFAEVISEPVLLSMWMEGAKEKGKICNGSMEILSCFNQDHTRLFEIVKKPGVPQLERVQQ